jgi:predicted nucleic acid-binding protein
VSLYLDASVLVALLTIDPLSARADALLDTHRTDLIVSDFAAAEFSSAIARRVRTGEIAREAGQADLANFDLWTARLAQRVEIVPCDVAAAQAYLRRLDLTLLTPDALHIAIAARIDATLVTFDRAMATSARALGMAVTTP